MRARDRLILIAAIGKAQGLSGQMRLQFFGDDAAELCRYKRFYGADGQVFTVKSLQFQRGAPILALEGVASREAAEALAETELYVKRSELADLKAEDEFYQEDLLGFAVFAENGEPLGTVSGFFNFGGGDLLELTLPPRADVELAGQAADGQKAHLSAKLVRQQRRALKLRKELIPFSKAAVPQIHIQAARLIVNKAAAGLLPAKISAEEAAAIEAENASACKET